MPCSVAPGTARIFYRGIHTHVWPPSAHTYHSNNFFLTPFPTNPARMFQSPPSNTSAPKICAPSSCVESLRCAPSMSRCVLSRRWELRTNTTASQQQGPLLHAQAFPLLERSHFLSQPCPGQVPSITLNHKRGLCLHTTVTVPKYALMSVLLCLPD